MVRIVASVVHDRRKIRNGLGACLGPCLGLKRYCRRACQPTYARAYIIIIIIIIIITIISVAVSEINEIVLPLLKEKYEDRSFTTFHFH